MYSKSKTKLNLTTTLFLSLLLSFSFAYAQRPKSSSLLSWQNAFIEIAKRVEPAVVSISATRIVESRFSPFDDMFKEFFGRDFDFFDRFFEFPSPERKYKQKGLGSGIIIDKKGLILTNEHVIEGAEEIKITLPDKRSFEGKVIGSDPQTDIAIVKIDPGKERLPVAEMGDSDNLEVGQWAIAIGNPFAYQMSSSEEKISSQPTVTVGVISALRRSVQISEQRTYEDLIQTDAAINPGNSGGPLVDIEGKIIGINTAILSPSGGNIGIGFAIPINLAKEILEDLITKGRVIRGWLGIIIQEMTPELAKSFGLSSPCGVLAGDVVENSPADKGGMRRGDIVLEFDGQEVNTTEELQKIVAKTSPDKRVKVVVIRKRVKKELFIKIGEGKEEKEPEERLECWRGLCVQGLTPELSKRYYLKEEEGVIVKEVKKKSPAEEAKIRVGDLIMEINGQKVEGLKEYNQALSKVDKKEDAVFLIKRGRWTLYRVISPEK